MSKQMKKSKPTPKAKQSSPLARFGVGSSGSDQRVRVSELQKHPIFGGRLTSNSSSLPAAFVNMLGNSSFYNESRKVLMPQLGHDPVSIVGCQPFCDVVTTNANNNLFTDATLATQYTANIYQICPDNLNGPLAAKANLYDQFVFRDLLFEYVSLVATSQAGGMSMGVFTDGLQTSGASSFSTTRQIVPSVAYPFRVDRAFLHWTYEGPSLYWNLFMNTDASDSRQTVQACFVGFPSASSIGNVSQGFINVYYVCDLYGPIPSSGFTLTVTSKADRDYVRSIIADMKKEESTPSDTPKRVSVVKAPAFVGR